MIINGKLISQSLRDSMRDEVATLAAQYHRAPRLDVIIVGSNPASQTYVRNKVLACEYVGIDGHLIELPETVSETQLLDIIEGINRDEAVDGLLVQLPLPAHIHEDRILHAIDPDKDVDGFHPQNVARLWLGEPCLLPCTPAGIMALLEQSGVEFAGKRAVVVGRSNIVGKPVAKLLLDRNCTVTIAHSRTADLPAVCREADILIAAVGRPRMITADYVRPGATVIDVGINRISDPTTASGTRLVGDVDFDAVEPVARAITPVPGGVGPMTITMLLRNTISAFLHRQSVGRSA